MNKKIFVVGFGISLMLVIVCVWYTFTPLGGNGVLDAFDVANRGWYVHQPAAYNLCLIVFSLLNLPVILLYWGLISAIGRLWTLPAGTLAIITFASLVVMSGGWWALVAWWLRSRTAAQISKR